MRIINANEHSTLHIGYEGENERVRVVFDLSDLIAEFGAGTAVLLVARPTEAEASPVLIEWDEESVYWDVTESDLAFRGEGEAQLVYTPEGTTIAKTRIWETSIDRALSQSENPPAPWAGWVASIIAAAQAAVEAEQAVPETVQTALAEAKASGEFDGTGIASISQNADFSLTIRLTDGTEYTTDPVKGEKGDKGDTGNGIASIALNADYTLTINMTDGTHYTTDPIRGEKGEKGDTGAVPNFTIGTVQTLAPGSSATASITGTQENPILNLGIPQGQQGVKGDTGNGIASVELNADYTLTINFTDGTHTTTTSIRGAKGDTGVTPDISIGTVETLAPGSQATATMTGTSENPVLNLGIPQGQPGEVSKAQLDTKAPVLIGEASGGVATVLDGADAMPFKDIWAEFLPIQAGSGDASPDNSRPISGLTGMTIRRGGKNILKNKLQSGSGSGITWTVNEDGSVSISGTAVSDPTTPGFMVINFNTPGLANRQILGYGPLTLVSSMRASYNPQISGVIFQSDIYVNNVYAGTVSELPRTYAEGEISVRTSRLKINEGTVIPEGTVFYPMIEIGRSPSDYEPCKTDEYIITWQSEAGTVYGALLNPLTGKMYITWLFVAYNGTENWRMGTSAHPSWFYIDGFDNRVAWTNLGVDFAISNDYKQQWAPAVFYMDHGRFGLTQITDGYRIAFKDTRYETLNDWKAHLAEHPVQVAYKITEPIEVDLTPVEILTLFGVNNVWTGVGNVSVEAPLDTKSYIDRLTQPDNDMVADADIPSGKYFSVNNKLYLSTRAIARGSAIVPNINCTETSIPEALNALNQ